MGDLSVPSTYGADDTSAPAKTDSSQELMTFFHAIVSVDFVDNILDKVLAASACLECKDNIQGVVIFVCKAKSLVQHWLTKPLDANADKRKSFEVGDTLIEGDVVLLVNVKVGKGATTSTVP
eukprot:451052-Ditylum_brightwellii.AAC.1